MYRPCAAACLFNENGEVMMCRRIGGGEKWQFPQGGIDEGETAEQGAARELKEETGIVTVELMAAASKPVNYEVRAGYLIKNKYVGQALHVVAFKTTKEVAARELNFSGDAENGPEFDQMKWVSPDQCLELIWSVKKPAYQLALSEFLNNK